MNRPWIEHSRISRPGPVYRRFSWNRSGFSPMAKVVPISPRNNVSRNQQHQIIIAMWGISRIAGLAVRQVRQQHGAGVANAVSNPVIEILPRISVHGGHLGQLDAHMDVQNTVDCRKRRGSSSSRPAGKGP
jgi:hypothetical protein